MTIKVKLIHEYKKPVIDRSYNFYKPDITIYGFEFRLYKALTSWRDSKYEDWTFIKAFETLGELDEYARKEKLKRWKVTKAQVIQEEKDQYEIIQS